jgi:uncharacterized membrane protein YdbT with pleckstrin-like domain
MASYPASLLSPGEDVVKVMRPHFRALIVPGIILIAVVVGLIYFGQLLKGTFFETPLYVLAAFLVVLFVVPKFVRWLTTLFVFTNRRIIVRKGLVARTGREIPLSKINSVSFNQTFMGRILNYGTLNVESANVEGEVYIEDIPNIQEIQLLVSGLMEADDTRRRLLGKENEL